MPIYTYECQSCSSTLERRQSFSDEPLKVHDDCGGSLRRVIHPAGIVFKGSGFYNTDYKNGTSSNTSADSTDGKADAAKSDSTPSTSGSTATASSDSSSTAASTAGSSSTAPSATPAPATV